jgi:hypothetical protein
MQSRADGASPFPRTMDPHRSRARSSWTPRLGARKPARMGAAIPPHVLFYLRVLPLVPLVVRQHGSLHSFLLDPHRYRHLASLRGSRYPRGRRGVNTEAGNFGGGRGWCRPYPLRAHARRLLTPSSSTSWAGTRRSRQINVVTRRCTILAGKKSSRTPLASTTLLSLQGLL